MAHKLKRGARRCSSKPCNVRQHVLLHYISRGFFESFRTAGLLFPILSISGLYWTTEPIAFQISYINGCLEVGPSFKFLSGVQVYTIRERCFQSQLKDSCTAHCIVESQEHGVKSTAMWRDQEILLTGRSLSLVIDCLDSPPPGGNCPAVILHTNQNNELLLQHLACLWNSTTPAAQSRRTAWVLGQPKLQSELQAIGDYKWETGTL